MERASSSKTRGPASAAAAFLVAHFRHLGLWDEYETFRTVVARGDGPLLIEAFFAQPRLLVDPDVRRRLVMKLTSALNVRGETDPPSLALSRDLAERAFAEDPEPDYLYNAACAWVRGGHIDEAAATLARAIALDPQQAADALRDEDFTPHLAHPALARVLGRAR